MQHRLQGDGVCRRGKVVLVNCFDEDKEDEGEDAEEGWLDITQIRLKRAWAACQVSDDHQSPPDAPVVVGVGGAHRADGVGYPPASPDRYISSSHTFLKHTQQRVRN